MSDNQQTTPATTDPAGVGRTPTGDIATGSQTTTPAATTPQTSTQPTEKPSVINEPAGSVVNQPADKVPAGAPETYSAFAVPDGWEIDKATNDAMGPLFKSLNLSQENAQKLVDFYIEKTAESQNAPFKFWQDTQAKWVDQVKADPVIGPRLNEVKTTISRAIDGLNDPKLARDFREAMDYTGAGNNPAFIKAFYKLAQMVTEGGHVAGNGPSPAGQQQKGGANVSAAKAMYPNLP